MQTYRRKKIEKTCSEIWRKYALVPGFDFSILLDDLSIKLLEENLSSKISAVLAIKGDKKLITLNKNDHPKRQRFSLGHELGHLFLEHKKDFDINSKTLIHHRDLKASEGTDMDEVEANFFSGTLLMPENEIMKLLDFNLSFDRNVDLIAEVFKVSAAAATLRLKYLGYE